MTEACYISYETYTASPPQSWEKFFNILFLHKTRSVNIQRKCDSIFQIIHYVIHNEKKHNLSHIGLVELDWLKQLFTKLVLNKVKSEQFDKSLFLGGSHKENGAMCVSFVNGWLVLKGYWNAHTKRLAI